MRFRLKRAAGSFDRTLRQYGIVVLFVAFSAVVSMGWIARAAASNIEQGLEPTRAEIRREQLHEERAQLTELAEHERRLTVMESEQKSQGKQLDDLEGYGKSLILGVFGLLGLQAWERVVGKRQKNAEAD